VKKAKEQRKKALAEQKKTQDEEAAAYDQDLQDTEAIDPNAKKLNERQRSMAQLIFVGIDMDGSGTLDEAECKQVMGKQAAGLFKFDAAKKGMASGAQEGGDKLIDIGEWMKYLIQKKINEGSESLDEMLEQMEEQVGPIREEKKKRREKKFGKEKVAPPKDLLRSNAFLYKLDEEQVAVSVEMWERLDSSCQGVVPRDKIVAMCESFEGEETSAEELLKHLGWDAYDNVNKNEWMRFIRRTKQIEGEEGMDKVLECIDMALSEEEAEENKPMLSPSVYRVKKQFNQSRARAEKGRSKTMKKVWKPDSGSMEDERTGHIVLKMDRTYPKSHRDSPPTKPRMVTKANSRKFTVFLFANDGKHEGAGVICECVGGFRALCEEAKVLMQQPVRRVFAMTKVRDGDGEETGQMDGFEISPGAGTYNMEITPGMELVVSAGEDFVPSDSRSQAVLKSNGLEQEPAPRLEEKPEEEHWYYDFDGHVQFGKEMGGDEEDG